MEQNMDINSLGAETKSRNNLFDLVPCIITVQDRNYKILKSNNEFESRFGSREGDFCFRAYKGRYEKCVDCPLEKTFRDGRIHHDEQMGLNKDGTAFHWLVKTSPIKNEQGDVISVMEMSIDITRQKLLQQQLEKSEREYYSIFNNIPNCVFILDADSLRIKDCNVSAEQNYGFTKKEFIDKPFVDLFADEDKKGCAAIVKSSHFLQKSRHRSKEGAMLFVNIRISPFSYNESHIFIVSCSNITKEVETEQQLIQACKLTTLGEMASGIAHELNQPLSVIKTASTFIMKKNKSREKLDEQTLDNLLRKIDKNMDRATGIITHMKNFSRKSEMKLDKIQINSVIENAFQIFNQQLKLRGIEVVRNLADNLPKIAADPNCLEQVFINLILNARDAIEERWNKEGDKPTQKRIIIQTCRQDNFVVAEIKDNGIGIPGTVADQIFEPFFTTKAAGKGTGLGLSISFSIIKEFNAVLYADRDKKDGAAFILKFPVKEKNDE